MTARFATPDDNAMLTAIMNHPGVKPWVTCDGAGEFDPSKYTAHPKSFAVVVEGGCWLLPALEQDAYGVHTALAPNLRGSRAIAAAHNALELVFTQTDALQLWTMVPANNPQALWFAHTMGFRDQYERADVWLSGGKRWSMAYLRMDIDDWIQRSSRMRRGGELFHEILSAQAAPSQHADDPMHDRYAGAAAALVLARQVEKAQHVYNRWARACGYMPFSIASRDPLRLDIHSHILRVDAEGIHIEEKAHA